MKLKLISIIGLTLIPISVVFARDRWIYVAPPSPIIVTEEAPALIVEPPIPCLGPGYVWVSGAWEAHRGHWVWGRGHWELPPRGRHVWAVGHWDYRDAAHRDRIWISAGWR